MLGYNNGPRATPVVDGPNVYTFGAEGVLQCVRVADGQMVWRIDTTERFRRRQELLRRRQHAARVRRFVARVRRRQPARRPDRRLRRQRQRPAQRLGSRRLRQSDRQSPLENGRRPRQLLQPGPRQNRRPRRRLHVRPRRPAGDRPDQRRNDRQFPWRARKLESVNASTPVVVGNEIFISETYELGSALVRFNGTAFEEVWTDRDRRRNQAMALHWNTPIEHDGYLYGSSGYHAPEAELRCVEWKTGKVMWSEAGMGRSSLLLVDGTLVCLSEDGTLRLLRPTPQKYDEIAKWEFNASDGSPLLPYAGVGRAGTLARPALYRRRESPGVS